MATSRTNAQEPRLVLEGTQERRQNLGAEQQKDLVRAVSPQALNQLWRSLEKNQDISYSYAEEEELEPDSIEAMNDEERMDSGDFSTMADEDALDEFDGEEPDDDNPNAFFLVVTIDAKGKAHCSAPSFDAYLSATPLTQLGENCLYELSSRGETLTKLAKWLEENRQKFLKSREIADLGEKAREECMHKKLPIYQGRCQWGKSLADVLGVDDATCGRHIRNVKLKWDGVIASLEILFCQETHEAWAVSVYKNKTDWSPEDLATLAEISGVDAETIKAKAQ